MSVILKNVDPQKNFDKIRNVLWSDIIEIICREKLTDTSFSLRYTDFYTKSTFRNAFVVYDVEALKQYDGEAWFYVQNQIVEDYLQKNCYNEERDIKQAERIDHSNEVTPKLDDDFDFDRTFSGFAERSFETDELYKNKTEITELANLMADLEETMEIQTKISACLYARIKCAVDGR